MRMIIVYRERTLPTSHTTAVRYETVMNPIITLLLEEDIIFLPEPGVRHVARIRLGLTGEECILGYVDGYVLWRGDDKWRSCKPKWETVWKVYSRFIPALQWMELWNAIMRRSYDLQQSFESLLNAGACTDQTVKSVKVHVTILHRYVVLSSQEPGEWRGVHNVNIWD